MQTGKEFINKKKKKTTIKTKNKIKNKTITVIMMFIPADNLYSGHNFIEIHTDIKLQNQ